MAEIDPDDDDSADIGDGPPEPRSPVPRIAFAIAGIAVALVAVVWSYSLVRALI